MITDPMREYEILRPGQQRWLITRLPNNKRYVLVEESLSTGSCEWTIVARFEDTEAVEKFVSFMRWYESMGKP